MIPNPPRKGAAANVRDFLLATYEWSDFVLAAYGAFCDAIQEERYGKGLPIASRHALNNILRKLFDGVGVRFENVVIHPDAFVRSARAWSPEECAEAARAVSRARSGLRDVILSEMEKLIPRAAKPALPLRASSLRECAIRLEPADATILVEVRVRRGRWVVAPKAGGPVQRVLAACAGFGGRGVPRTELKHYDPGRFRRWFREVFAVDNNPDPLPCKEGIYYPQWRSPSSDSDSRAAGGRGASLTDWNVDPDAADPAAQDLD